jgi:hypothetical protein
MNIVTNTKVPWTFFYQGPKFLNLASQKDDKSLKIVPKPNNIHKTYAVAVYFEKHNLRHLTRAIAGDERLAQTQT